MCHFRLCTGTNPVLVPVPSSPVSVPVTVTATVPVLFLFLFRFCSVSYFFLFLFVFSCFFSVFCFWGRVSSISVLFCFFAALVLIFVEVADTLLLQCCSYQFLSLLVIPCLFLLIHAPRSGAKKRCKVRLLNFRMTDYSFVPRVTLYCGFASFLHCFFLGLITLLFLVLLY
jgi:hypothetical protein